MDGDTNAVLCVGSPLKAAPGDHRQDVHLYAIYVTSKSTD